MGADVLYLSSCHLANVTYNEIEDKWECPCGELFDEDELVKEVLDYDMEVA